MLGLRINKWNFLSHGPLAEPEQGSDRGLFLSDVGAGCRYLLDFPALPCGMQWVQGGLGFGLGPGPMGNFSVCWYPVLSASKSLAECS